MSAVEDGYDDGYGGAVVEFSVDQRWPSGAGDEPMCIVCRRFGAYVCDDTDADVCSKQCKTENLRRAGMQQHDIHDNEDDDNDGVVLRRCDQRWPQPDEPVCIVCGRFAEYVCDATEVDVCSQQCKIKHLELLPQNQNVHAEARPQEPEIQHPQTIDQPTCHVQPQPDSQQLSQCKTSSLDHVRELLPDESSDLKQTLSCLSPPGPPPPQEHQLDECSQQRQGHRETGEAKDESFHLRTFDGLIHGPQDIQGRQTRYSAREQIASLERLRASLGIRVSSHSDSDSVPEPIESFNDAELPSLLLKNLQEHDYEWPTPVQMQCIPLAMEGSDVVVCSPTASGKTLAFLVPLLALISERRWSEFEERKHRNDEIASRGKALAIILAPTRELCSQIEEQAKKIAKGLPVRTALIVGGLPIKPQIHRLEQGVQIVIATPGRLLDILQKRPNISLDEVAFVVLDEFDAMLIETDFRESVVTLKTALNSHQTLLFSATSSETAVDEAKKITDNAAVVVVSSNRSVASSIKQVLIWVEEKSKKRKLFQALWDARYWKPPVVVFVNLRVGAELLARAIAKVGDLLVWPCRCFNQYSCAKWLGVFQKCEIECRYLHGDMPQTDRLETLRAFENGDFPVLVSTAVAGRGLDLVHVNMVVNFDMAPTLDAYVHRIGRCGRGSTPGLAMTFINDCSKSLFCDLVGFLTEKGVSMPVELRKSPWTRDSKRPRR